MSNRNRTIQTTVAKEKPVHLLGLDKRHIINLEPVTNDISEVTCENCLEQLHIIDVAIEAEWEAKVS